VSKGDTPDCDDQAETDTCGPEIQAANAPSSWNPLPGFTTFAENVRRNPRYADHVTETEHFYADIANGRLADVSWIVPSKTISEHPVL
jgi:hypothetical protein